MRGCSILLRVFVAQTNIYERPSRLINHVEDKAKISRLSPVEIQTILVPTDLRPESMIALRYALTLAKQFDANLTLLHVLEEPCTSDTELQPGAEELPVLKKNNEERELALLEDELCSEYLNWRSCFRAGSAFRQIMHEAETSKRT